MSWFHQGGDINRDERGCINWQCRSERLAFDYIKGCARAAIAKVTKATKATKAKP